MNQVTNKQQPNKQQAKQQQQTPKQTQQPKKKNVKRVKKTLANPFRYDFNVLSLEKQNQVINV